MHMAAVAVWRSVANYITLSVRGARTVGYRSENWYQNSPLTPEPLPTDSGVLPSATYTALPGLS